MILTGKVDDWNVPVGTMVKCINKDRVISSFVTGKLYKVDLDEYGKKVLVYSSDLAGKSYYFHTISSEFILPQYETKLGEVL